MANNDNNRGNPGQKRDEEGQFTSSNNRQGSRSDQGGSHSKSASQGRDNPGNFANDREKASEAGRKGGQNSHGGQKKDDANDW